jgi:hypothetical protein
MYPPSCKSNRSGANQEAFPLCFLADMPDMPQEGHTASQAEKPSLLASSPCRWLLSRVWGRVRLDFLRWRHSTSNRPPWVPSASWSGSSWLAQLIGDDPAVHHHRYDDEPFGLDVFEVRAALVEVEELF